MSNATPWPKMIKAVYQSFETNRHQGDAIARRIMDRVVSWLAGGLELSPKLQAALIANINMRTKFSAVDPGFPVRLTRDQLAYARRNNPEWFDLGMAGFEDDAEIERKSEVLCDGFTQAAPEFTLPLRQFSDVITTSFRLFYDSFPTEARALAQYLVSMTAENSDSGTTSCAQEMSIVMEREEKKSNHEQDMIFASQIGFHDQPDTSHEPHSAPIPGQSIEAGHEGEVKPADAAPVVTIWVKPDKTGKVRASGYLDRGQSKWALTFTGFDHALERIGQNDNQFFDYMSADIAQHVLPNERQAISNGSFTAGATMSGLYGTKDTFARKNPVSDSTAVLLEWEGDVPTGAYLIEGTETRLIPLTKENDRYKGRMN